MPTIYVYKNCDTCRKALKWLTENSITHEAKAIRETPPTAQELKAALDANGSDLRPLFNTSGNDYRELGLKDRLPTMTESEAISLLSGNGNLVKRPFFICGEKILVGFKPEVWETELL